MAQWHSLLAADATHSHTAQAPPLTQHHDLQAADSTHTHTAEGPNLSAATSVAAADAAHQHSATSPAVDYVHIVVGQEATHSHTVQTPKRYVVNGDFSVASADGWTPSAGVGVGAGSGYLQVTLQTAPSGFATYQITGAVVGREYTVTCDFVGTSAGGSQSFAINEGISDIWLTAGQMPYRYTAADTAFGLKCYVSGGVTEWGRFDNIQVWEAPGRSLAQHHDLQAADSAHAHTADSPGLTQWHDLVAQGTIHVHTAALPPMVYVAPYKPPERMYAVAAENRLFDVESEDRILGITKENRLIYIQRSN
jgi:hypothetical protein